MHMRRTKSKDQSSDLQLQDKVGILAQLRWQQGYIMKILEMTKDIFQKPPDVEVSLVDPWNQVKHALPDPLALHALSQGSRTWIKSLPNEPMQLLVTHVLQLYHDEFRCEIKGALNEHLAGKLYTPEKCWTSVRVKTVFAADFEKSLAEFRKNMSPADSNAILAEVKIEENTEKEPSHSGSRLAESASMILMMMMISC